MRSTVGIACPSRTMVFEKPGEKTEGSRRIAVAPLRPQSPPAYPIAHACSVNRVDFTIVDFCGRKKNVRNLVNNVVYSSETDDGIDVGTGDRDRDAHVCSSAGMTTRYVRCGPGTCDYAKTETETDWPPRSTKRARRECVSVCIAGSRSYQVSARCRVSRTRKTRESSRTRESNRTREPSDEWYTRNGHTRESCPPPLRSTLESRLPWNFSRNK